MRDTRRAARRFVESVQFDDTGALLRFCGCLLLAAAVAFLPEWQGLEPAARRCLFVLLLAAGLWATEAIPGFAVAFLVIGLSILLLGRPDGVFAAADEPDRWQIFIAPFASPLIWLFLAGFILAEAAARTGLDRTLASMVFRAAGTSATSVLVAAMGITFVLSMFMSNTATAAMMITVIAPLLATLPPGHVFRPALPLAIALAANLGGMGTLVGTPPNAIAAGFMSTAGTPLSFTGWMLLGLPPALLLAACLGAFIVRRYGARGLMLDQRVLETVQASDTRAPLWQQGVVVLVFITTLSLWIFGSAPAAVVAFVPITVLSVTGVIGIAEIRQLRWDVLILMAGGLSLGVAVTATGLAGWLVESLSLTGLGLIGAAFAFALLTAGLSNFMSNTAAANILVPLGAAAAMGVGGAPGVLPVIIALSASTAMCLPIATPPNAIAYSTGELRASAFLVPGLVLAILTPLLTVPWVSWLLPLID
ncbi:DASS family sodium-coupled anion symporter [Wenzhouxiangella sp. XN24]|uniref:DASS family sodium-coupled anion symporter n=1 Tax=Wenzhouxiangella sp. XN24 TaxID=2713569 RepID=UPI0013EC8440|nr:DASS family sodium-coupled anion symporter [Wenzhouxiangella sp. XN24]